MKLKFNKRYLIIALLIFLIEVYIAFVIKTGFIRYTLGDYLVVILGYALIRGCTNLKVLTSAMVMLFIAFVIEFLQLTPFLSYFNLENNLTAKLIFGTTFQVDDLIAYTLGIITILLIEHYGNTKIAHQQKV